MMSSSGGISVQDTDGNFDSNFTKNITRLLQHSILQLCNEHVGYQRTLQVLGVLCMTIDDKQQELVVKVNNTLKRVNPITPPKDSLLYQSPAEYQSQFVGGVSPSAPPSHTASSVARDLSYGSPDGIPTFYLNGSGSDVSGSGSSSRRILTTVRAAAEEMSGEGGGGRGEEDLTRSDESTANEIEDGQRQKSRPHGRKQTNPIRVKHVYDEGGGDSASLEGDAVVTIEPMDPDGSVINGSSSPSSPIHTIGSTDTHTPSSEPSELTTCTPSFMRLKKTGLNASGASAAKRRLNDLFGVPSSVTLDNIFTSSTPSSSSATVRALLASRTRVEGGTSVGEIKRELNNEEVTDYGAPPLIIVPDDCENEVTQQSLVVRHKGATSMGGGGVGVGVGQDGALNFSLCALNGLLQSSSSAAGGGNNVMSTILSTAPILRNGLNEPLKDEQRTTFYPGFEFLVNAGDYMTTDTSGFSKTFVTFGGGGSAGTLQMGDGTTLSLAGMLQGGLQVSADQMGVDMSTRGNDYDNRARNSSSSMFTISNCVRDGLAMHLKKSRITGLPIKPRIRSRVGISGRSMKVKDIIMYDDSAPLHAQRGSKIEGDFLLDSLNVEGKKRRRRTAEDTLTPEEIAEYMGSSSLALAGTGGTGFFRCRFCSDVTSDLSRYFNHTLSAHAAYICHQCGKSFTTKSSLLRHRPIHTGMRRFACSICRKAFYRKDKCKAHIKRHLGANPDGTGNSAIGAAPSSEQSVLQSPPPHVQVAAL